MRITILCVILLAVPFCLFAAERPMLDRMASVSITSGKPEQIGNLDVQDHDIEIVSRRAEGGGTRKYFWRLAEKEELTITVRLPAETEDVATRILMDSSVKQGEAHLAWNGQIVGEQDEPFVLRSGEGGRNTMKFYLDDPKPENQLKLTGTKGEIDITAVEFRYRVPCPSWENDEVRMTLLAPEPDTVVAKRSSKEGGSENSRAAEIDLRWLASGPMEQGWIKIEYSETGKDQWTAVPGAEGISFGSKEWRSEKGSFTWRYEGDLPNLELRIIFNRGTNPIEERQREERKTADAASGLRKNFLELKRKSLEEIKIAIDPTLWRRHDADGQRTATRSLDQARGELSKPDADIMLVERYLADADTAILRAFEKMETSFSGQEDTEVATWKDLLLVVDLYLKEREIFEEDMAKATEKTSESIKGLLAASPVSFSSVEAVELLQKLAMGIRYKIGRCFYYGKGAKQDYAEAVKWYRMAADAGGADGQRGLGWCYLEGEGVAKDPEEAVKWFRKAAEQGDAKAQANLGVCYLNGEGVSEDTVEGVKWFRMAAEQGDANAQARLGNCYILGRGVPKDPTEAIKWFHKAAEQGDAMGQFGLGVCYLSGEGVLEDPVERVKWFRKAAEQGDAMSQYNLGICYLKGEGVPKDPAEAIKWFRKAAEQGLAYAQGRLGWCYQNGEGVPKNPAEGVKWYRKAAEQDHAFAQWKLGFYYELGDSVTKDMTEAVKWYRKAAEQNDAMGQYFLGLCYLEGKGMRKDEFEAIKWLRKASEQGHEKAKEKLKQVLR